jgi:YD repeat-containing protein
MTRRREVLSAIVSLAALFLLTGCGPSGGQPPRSQGDRPSQQREGWASDAPDWAKYTTPLSEETTSGAAPTTPVVATTIPQSNAGEEPRLGSSEPSSSPATAPSPQAGPQAKAPPAPLVVERTVREIPYPDDIRGDTQLHWVSELGPGGMFVPQLPYSPPEEDEGLTKVLGAVFPEDSRDILFLGLRDSDLPPISTDDLLDAFLLAYHAVGGGPPPGVSIDPRPQQLQAGLREGDMMDVVYFGGLEQSEYGFAAFEADRLMKCLSAGKDNITREPFMCGVPGYQSELALLAGGAEGRDAAWHRFWIEYESSNVAHGSDGRSFMAIVKLGVHTQYMEVQNGKLVSGNRPPDPVSKKFSSHLTDHYAKYAEEFLVFNRLEAFATVTSIADAIREDEQSELRRQLDEEWRLDEHPPRLRSTPEETPAVVASAPTPGGVAQLTGGVTLAPDSQHHRQHPRTNTLQQATLASLTDQLGQRQWSVSSEGRQYQVVRARPHRTRRTWQEDLRVGSLRLVREYGPRDSQGEEKPGWYFQAPHVRLDKELADYKDSGKAPKAAHLYDEEGRAVTLSKFGQLTMPGNAATPGYATADDTRSLYLYKNAWMYLEGDVQFVSINGGPPTAELGPGARIVQFSPSDAENHRVQWVLTPEGKTFYEYDGARLALMRNEQGEAIRFVYDSSGRLTQAVGNNNQTVSYFYDQQGRLKQIISNQGAGLSYIYGEGSDAPIGVRSEMRQHPAAERQPASQALVQVPQGNATASSLGDSRTRYVVIEEARDERGGYLLTILGDGQSTARQRRLSTDYSNEMLDSLANETLGDLKDGDAAVVVGPWDISNLFALSLRKSGMPAMSASLIELAIKNAHSAAPDASEARFIVHKPSVKRAYANLLPESYGPEKAKLVFLVGHYDPAFVEMLHAQGKLGAFVDADVVQIVCRTEETPGDVENILGSYGAVSVTGFNQPIPQPVLAPLMSAIEEVLNNRPSEASPGAMRKHQTIEKFIRQAIEELQRNPSKYDLPPSVTPSDLENLKGLYERIGRLFNLRGRAHGQLETSLETLAA